MNMKAKTNWALLFAFAIVLMTAGCATTDDPRQGGLFSYNPEVYQRRIAEKQARYDAISADTTRQQQEARSLEDKVNQKRAEKEELTQKLASLDADLTKTEAKIKQTRAQTKDQERRRSQLTAKLDSLKQQRLGIDSASSTGGDEAAKKAEVERLQQEIDRLLKEAEALSKL